MQPLNYWHSLTRAERFGSVSDFWRIDVPATERALRTRPASYWVTNGERRALKLFHAAAQRVPAYKAFLRSHGIAHTDVRTIEDLERVPFTDKQNYINHYPLAERCWDGALHESSLIAVSSGTSGEPKFWPRGGRQEMEAALIHEMAYRSLFDIHRRKTLAVIGFPMGIYVSGVATLLPTWLIAPRKYPLTAVSVGNHKDQALKVIKELGKQYDQVLLVGHPFFVKDLIETGRRERVSWKKLNVRMLFCSEGFSEQWRRYLNAQAGLASNAMSSFNTYGSSELLLMGHETPVSVAVRRTIKTSHVPNLFQYNPLQRFIQTDGEELLFTADSGIPLIRFNLHDAGEVMSFAQGTAPLKKLPRGVWKLPFVTLRGRADHTLVFYAANIYPEHVHSALNAPRFLNNITGKFTMRKDYDKKQEAYLELNVELQPKIRASTTLRDKLAVHVTKELRRINMEYDFLWEHLGKDLTPRVILRPYQHPTYFRPGLKPKYIIKDHT
jgi:phenylacetate-CoA ligase